MQLQDGPRIAFLSRILSYWTVGIEGMVALLFLVPDRFRLSGLRDASLLTFMMTTYPIATVIDFGRVLAVLGLVQSPNRLGLERLIYLAYFLLLPVFQFPFANVIRALLRSSW